METVKTIAIYGKSGHGKVIADIAHLNGYETIIWIDDNAKEAITFKEYLRKYLHVKIILAIGDNKIRAKITTSLKQKNAQLKTLIHPTAVIANSTTIADGCVIMANVVINADSTIAEGTILNTSSVIEHDATIEEFVHISPNVSLAGNVHVKKLSHIGIGSSVIQNITIGENSIVGAGSVVIKNIDANSIAVGVPATIKKCSNE